jgi:hypothetical protein
LGAQKKPGAVAGLWVIRLLIPWERRADQLASFSNCTDANACWKRLPGGEEHAHVGDAARRDFVGGGCALARNAQAKAAEIAQFDDLAVDQFVGHHGDEILQREGRVARTGGGNLGGLLRNRVEIVAPAAFENRIILGLHLGLAWVFLGGDTELNHRILLKMK